MKWTVKPTKKQMKAIRKGIKTFKEYTETYEGWIRDTEKWMERETGIEGIEIFRTDCGAGIGNNARTMKLIRFD